MEWRWVPAGFPELTGEAIGALDTTVHRLLDEADCGDPEAIAVIERAGAHLGIGVANHLNATDPGTVLILIAHDRLRLALTDKIMQVASKNTLPGIMRRTRLIIDAATRDWRWKGTAALALEKLYLEDELPIASQTWSAGLDREQA